MNVANGVTLTAAATAFDRVASTYDAQFTRTNIGQAQRRQVWQSLLAAFPVGSRILELNCGTGEDARFLAKRRRSVVACDASASMIEVARRHDRNENQSTNVQYLCLPNEELSSLPVTRMFDGAFSNFSGLNCLADLSNVARDLANLIKPESRLLICVWSRVCVAEILWLLLHGQPKKSIRRFQRKSLARLGGLTISVTYHTVSDLRRSFSPWFELRSRRAIGLAVPPSYAEQWVSRHTKLLAGLELFDHAFAQLPFFRDLGDHVLLEFVRCKP
jgi:ubiquinone/menaquinone biosynthesis C-methylase UbiE